MERSRVLLAYKHLFREGLRAVQYSKPSRYTLQRILRSSFRSEPAVNFNQQRVDNTLHFLRMAARETGIEHKVLKNLLIVRFWQHKSHRENRM